MSAALLDHLWQSSLVALGAWILTFHLRNNSARLRFGVWLAASIKFLIPFSLLVLIGEQLRPGGMPEGVQMLAAVGQSEIATLLVSPAQFALPAEGGPATGLIIFATIWSCGFVALLIRWCARWTHIRKIMRSATPIDIAAPIPTMTSLAFREPGVVGILRPVLLLPAGIDSRLTPKQLRAILKHELCHVDRRDNLSAAIHMVVEALFWFFPPVWWIGARMIDERERACDEAVVQSGHDAQMYAEGILKVCRSYLTTELPCVSGAAGANLKTRLEAIMKNADMRELSRGRKLVLGVLALSAVAAPVLFGLTVSNAVYAATEIKAPAPAANQAGKIELLPGKRVKLHFQNVEVRSLLKSLAEASQVNMLVSDAVTGNVTVDLAEMPWDQALSIVLNSQGLVKREKDGILFVEPASP